MKGWRERHETEGLFTLKITPGAGLCMVRGCRKTHAPGRVGLCHAHYQFRWRSRNRKQSAYATLRDHAIARGLAFTVSYDYFLGMLDCIGFWDHEAETRGEWLTLDRVDATLGYEPGNLRVISSPQNTVKSNRERHLPEHVQSVLARKRATAKEHPALSEERGVEDDRCPF